MIGVNPGDIIKPDKPCNLCEVNFELKRLGLFRQKYSSLTRFLLSYIVILLIPLLTGMISYNEAVRLVEKDAREANLSLLEQTKDILDKRFDEIDSIVTQIANSTKIKRMMNVNGPLEGANAFIMYDALRDLSYYIVRNNFIADFFIYFKNSDIIISSRSSYTRLPIYYEPVLKYGNMTYEEWHREILDSYHCRDYLPSTPAVLNGKMSPVITYVQSIPLEYPGGPIKGNIMILIDENEINKLLSRLNINDGGWAYIADNTGQIITCISRDKSALHPLSFDPKQSKGFKDLVLSEKKMTISYTTSTYNGWIYVTALPYQVAMTNANHIKNATLTIMLITLLLGIMIAFFLAYKNSTPLQKIAAMLKELFDGDSDSGFSGYAYLQSSISRLIESNNDLKSAMQKQVPVIEAAFFHRLLKGEFYNLNEIEAILAQTDIKMCGSWFVVIILHINGYHDLITKDILKELSMTIVVIKDIISNVTHDNLHVHSINNDKVALIVGFDSDNVQDCISETEAMLKKIDYELVNRYNIKVSIAAGNLYDSRLLISQSFNEALYALDYMNAEKENGIIWYSRLPNDNKTYYYPMDVETRLTNLLKAGDKQGMESLLQDIYRKNFEERKLSKDMILQMIYEVRGTIIKVLDQITTCNREKLDSLKKSLNRVIHSENPDALFKGLFSIYGLLCDIINERKKCRNVELINKITDYLNKAYTDPDLCLCKVASQFDISEVYLCQFFKEKTGENFSDYLENIRMQQACELLAITDMSVNDIAIKAGYNSAHAFRRALKRVKGINPLDYRELNRVTGSGS